MADQSFIISKPEICGGVPVFAGTRIPVYLILDLLSNGNSIAEVLKDYPDLTEEAVYSALKFASDILHYKEEIIEITD